jgi:hypothetical protein
MRLSDAQIYGSLLFLDMTEAVMILYDRGSTPFGFDSRIFKTSWRGTSFEAF